MGFAKKASVLSFNLIFITLHHHHKGSEVVEHGTQQAILFMLEMAPLIIPQQLIPEECGE